MLIKNSLIGFVASVFSAVALVRSDTVDDIDPNGYLLYCPCMGKLPSSLTLSVTLLHNIIRHTHCHKYLFMYMNSTLQKKKH